LAFAYLRCTVIDLTLGRQADFGGLLFSAAIRPDDRTSGEIVMEAACRPRSIAAGDKRGQSD